MAADQGSMLAQFNLGAIHIEDHGIPKDYDEAIKWFRKSAKQGFAKAQNMLGAMYVGGFGVKKDSTEGYAWCKIASLKGLDEAQNILKTIEEKMTPDEIDRANQRSKELMYELDSPP
jgi:TPR repeat protein